MLRTKFPADFPASFAPPAWVVSEVQQRIVLLLNHVLMQESAARERLQRQQGRQVRVCWREQVFECRFTPAGLVECVSNDSNSKAADLVLRLTEPSPLALAQTVLQGDKPAIHIEGDVQLAAEVNWLFDHVRWDPEEDVARLIGDAPAHSMVKAVKRAADALRAFVQQKTAKATS